jgi:hypothetical protein
MKIGLNSPLVRKLEAMLSATPPRLEEMKQAVDIALTFAIPMGDADSEVAGAIESVMKSLRNWILSLDRRCWRIARAISL